MSDGKRKILGLSIGQLSTASLMVDGKIVACVSEERFSRNKNDMSYPKNAIEYCLEMGNVKGEDLDMVALATINEDPTSIIIKRFSDFSVQDEVRAQKEYWYPKIYENKENDWLEIFKEKVDYDQYPGGWNKIDLNENNVYESYKSFIHNVIFKHINVDKNKIVNIDHHTAHAMYAYFGSPFRNEDCLIFTADACRDGISATISTVKDGKIKRITESKTFNIARLYRYITLLLGMKPNEHEYKVMGLAPYTKPYLIKKPYEVFKETLYVDGLEFKFKIKPKDHYYYFKEKLEGCRFDGIAGGLQKYVEEILIKWVSNTVKETGIKKIVFSGGVAMNIKAMKEIIKLPEVADFFVCPSGGDESLAIGACYKTIYDVLDKNNIDMTAIKPLGVVYLGPEFLDDYIESMIKEKKLEDKYKISRNISVKEVAQMLADGKVIGRCVGRMEFGARALGNRSILANPKFPNIVQKINEQIKNRDFWMPFTPSMLSERVQDYLINPKKIQSPFMTIGFETTAKAREDLPGALHPADFTARPQFVKKEDNPEYHELIKEFENITGVGALLNTSFNLHGYPIVMSPEDALQVFENSDIDSILLNSILITKK